MKTKQLSIILALTICALFSTDLSAQRTESGSNQNAGVNAGTAIVIDPPPFFRNLGLKPIYIGLNFNRNTWSTKYGSLNSRENRIINIDGKAYRGKVYMGQLDGQAAIIEIGDKFYDVENFVHARTDGYTLRLLQTEPDQRAEVWENVVIYPMGLKIPRKKIHKGAPQNPLDAYMGAVTAIIDGARYDDATIEAIPGGYQLVLGTVDGDIYFTIEWFEPNDQYQTWYWDGVDATPIRIIK